MLLRIVGLIAAFGAAFAAAGVMWRYVCPRFVTLSVDDDLALLAVRDGVAVALVVLGVGIALVAVGTLELLDGYGAAGRPERPLVALASTLPVREAGALLVAGGVGLLGGSLLVPSGIEALRRFRA